MRQNISLCLVLIQLIFINYAVAQPWSGVLAPNRAADWSKAGATTIENRATRCGAIVTSDDVQALNTKIANCPAGSFVEFDARTFNFSGNILISGKSNITLRGAGPDKTIIKFTGYTGCPGFGSSLGGSLCIRAANTNDISQPGNTATWDSGYAKNNDTITLSNVSNLQSGSILMLDQLNDPGTTDSSDDNEIWISRIPGVNCQDCSSPSRSTGGTLRTQVQATTVTAVNTANKQVTIDPPVIWPNFGESGKQPGAWWATGPALTGIGIENLTVDTENSGGGGSSIFMANVKDSWVKNVRVTHCRDKCVWLYQSVRVTVRDSYFFDKHGSDASQEGSESYGADCYLCSMFRFENNIAHHITAPWICESGVGGVIGYNYSFDDFYTVSDPDWAQASYYVHGTCAYNLNEGNHGFGMIQDIVHAPNYLMTAFRNRWEGWETPRTQQTIPVHIYAPNRFSNIVGNVLGTSTYHTKYESFPGDANNCDKSIFALGFGGNCGSASIANKTNVRTFLMRWGNYDTVSASNRFLASEVPSGISLYPNPVPASQALPNSFYLPSSKPDFFLSTDTWPPIGPDVTGGNVSNVGGRAYKIPALRCYENSAKDTQNTNPEHRSGLLSFNADNCYGSTNPSTPLAPSNLRAN